MEALLEQVGPIILRENKANQLLNG